MSSSSPPADADAAAADTQSQQTQSKPLQATEQQLKARAEGVSIEDYLLPRSITLRLAKSVLPPNTSVQKDAVLAIQKAATVFVSYLSSAANESTPKRTVTPADVLNALSEIEFEGFRPRLEREFDAFTESKAAKRRPKKGEAGGEASGAGDGQAQTETQTETGAEGSSGEKKYVVVRGVRGVKRVKRDGNGNGNGADVEAEDEEDQDHDMEDEQEQEEVEEEHNEDATEEEEDEDEDVREDEDIDRAEGLDHLMDPDAGGDTDSDEEGPGSQLRGDLGLG